MLYFTRFLPDLALGGGTRRMLQVLSHLEQRGATLVSSARQDLLSEAEKAALVGRVAALERDLGPGDPELGSWSPHRRRAVLTMRSVAECWARNLNRIPLSDPVLVDDPIYFEPLMDALRTHGIGVVAVCHNLESMASQQVAAGDRLALLGREVELLRQCRAVVTISSEEAHWLEAWDVRAVHFPYFPVAPYVARHREVRRRRGGRPGQGAISLLNMLNPQNRSILEQVGALWRDSGLADTLGPLEVTGLGLEPQAGTAQVVAGVRLLGTLSDARLDDRLVQVGCMLCHQTGGSGALTRIPEALLCGVPVVASFNAARSYHHVPGVTEYSGAHDLAERVLGAIAEGNHPPEPTPPDPTLLLGLLDTSRKPGR